jgi:glycosyltransferase involved in cell wall biosynthesis
MKIGIDARLLERRMTGIGRYLENIVRHIPECDAENEYVLFSYRPLAGFPKGNMKNVATTDAAAEGALQKIRSVLWLHTVLPRFIKKEKIDVFFSPNMLLPLFGAGKKNIITIHDTFHLIDPKFHSPIYRAYISFFLSQTFKETDHILTVSEASKRDIVRLLHVPEEKITVTYEAAEERFMPREIPEEERTRLRAKYGLPGEFMLYVGVIEERKNIAGLIKIADGLKGKTDLPIVLVGRLGYRGEDYIDEIKKRDNMNYVGFVDYEDLPFLYDLATLFIFPSRYEGFGLPPLEAMQSGVPVVASNASSLPEVVGDAGILLSPDDYEGFISTILELLSNSGKRAELREKGLAQAKNFSFEKMTYETVSAILGL